MENIENPVIEFELFIKKLGKDTLTYIPAKLVPGIITIVSVAIFTRIFKPADYGKYVLVFVTTFILTAIFSQWIIQSALRYRAKYVYESKTSIFNRNFFSILLLLSLTLGLLSIVFYPFSKILSSYQQFYTVSVLIIISGIWFNSLVTVFQADFRITMFSLSTIINAIFKFLLALILILFVLKDIICLLWGVFLAYSIGIILMLLTYKSNNRESRSLENKSNKTFRSFLPFLKQFLIYGFPMTGWFLGAQLLNISDRYFLQIFRGGEEVGIYSSNYNLIYSAVLFISMPLLTAAHPLLMKAGTSFANQKEEIQKLITAFSRYFLIIAFPVMIYVTILFKELADIFLGLEYRRGGIILPIVLYGLLAWRFAIFGHKGLEFREKTNIMFMYVMICTGVKIVLNILFVPRYGYIAAAVATLICFFIYPILVYWGTKSDIEWIIPWASFIKMFIASLPLIISFIVIKTFQFNSIVTLILSGIIMLPIYLKMLLLLKEIRPYEINYFNEFLKKTINIRRKIC